MKKLLSMVLVGVIFFSVIGQATVGAATAPAKVMTIRMIYKDHEKTISFPDVKPYIKNGSTYAPVEILAAAFGATVTKNPKTPNAITVSKKVDVPLSDKCIKGVNTVTFTIGAVQTLSNGGKKEDITVHGTANPEFVTVNKVKRFCVPVAYFGYKFGAYCYGISEDLTDLKVYMYNLDKVEIPADSEYEKLVPLNPDIPKRLYDYVVDGKYGKLSVLKGHYILFNQPNFIPHKDIEALTGLAKEYAEFWNNIDYRTLDASDFKKKAYKFLSSKASYSYNGKKELTRDQYIDAYIQDCKDNKVVMKAEYKTDENNGTLTFSSLRDNALGDYVRGTLFVYSESPTKESWLYKGQKNGGWYQMDNEYLFNYTNGGDKWRYCLSSENYLCDAKPLEDDLP